MPARPMRPDDVADVHEMMRALWPDFDGTIGPGEQVMVWEKPASDGGGLGGFASYSIRPSADVCDSTPVPYLEGWWVAPDLRRKGVGRALVAAIEAWAKLCGFRELGSDALVENSDGVAAHKALGFEAIERVVLFRKRLR